MKPIHRITQTIRVVVLAAAGFATGSPCPATASEEISGKARDAFASRFAKPAANNRIIKIIHGWPDEPSAQDTLIRSLQKQGFGGVVCNVSFSDYLQSETKWTAFKRAIVESKKAGFALWLYDEKGYPSGNAGGLVLKKNPEWEAEGLLIAEAEGTGSLAVELPPGKLVFAGAFPIQKGATMKEGMVEITDQVKGKTAVWSAPPGRWRLVAVTESKLYEGTHASMSLAEHMPYPNLLLAEPTRKFLELTHAAYAAHLDEDLGKTFVSTFTDEPSLMSLFLKRMPYRVLPWSKDLLSAFRARHGGDLFATLPALIGDSGPEGQRARYEFWDTVGEQVSQNFFGQIQKWCGAHNVLSGGHLLMEENLVNQVGLYGDFFRCLRRLDAPSIDCLTSIPGQVPWFIAKLASSAAALERKKVVMCETSDHSQRYRPQGDTRPPVTVGKTEIRGTCNRLLAGGVNAITSYYSFAGLNDQDLQELNTWVGRCCAAMSGGQAAARIAVLYPVQSVWPRYRPGYHYANDSAAATRVETVLLDVCETLVANTRDFTVVDERTLAEASVKDRALSYADMQWNVVVLPCADTLPLKAWENLARFVQNGGLLISVGARPANSEKEFPCERVEALGREMFGDGAQQSTIKSNGQGSGVFLTQPDVAFLPGLLDRAVERDFTQAPGTVSLRYNHRRIDGQEVFLLINDSSNPLQSHIGFAGGTGRHWDPATGQGRVLNAVDRIQLDLPPYGASVLTLSGVPAPVLRPLIAADLPNRVTRELPTSSPTIARGEFVRETVTKSSDGTWQISGLITKGQTDTFLFTRFGYTNGVDLSDAESIVVDTRVPEGQGAATQLLVILHEKSGTDYLAHSGRMLSAPRDQQIVIPLSRFQLAGWSKDTNNQFDRSEVSEIRIGWGGYYGMEGETVEFTTGAPRAAAIRSPQ